MIRILMAVLLALSTLFPAFAAEQPASEASIRELMVVTESKKLIEGTVGQVDAMMQASMQQALAGRPVSPDQQKILDQMRVKMLALLKEQLSWSSMEPMMIDIYQKTFTEQEVKGMLDFYRTDAGKAVIAKMPLVMQHTMQAMQARMSQMMPKMQQLQQQTLAQLKDTRK
ncbi:MAG TPA: DUF2059 domain-containing protein [Gallionellaceae bacterium]